MEHIPLPDEQIDPPALSQAVQWYLEAARAQALYTPRTGASGLQGQFVGPNCSSSRICPPYGMAAWELLRRAASLPARRA